MPKSVPIQNKFSAGEISERFISQIDEAIYKSGVRSLINWVPQAQGPVYRRNGFRYHGQVPGTSGRLFPFSVTSLSVFYVILTDEGKLYVASPDRVLDDGNVISNPSFLQGATSWTETSQNSGYVVFGTGGASLVPGTIHPVQDRYAGLRQAVTLASGAVDHNIEVATNPNETLADMRVMVGSTAGASDLYDRTVGEAVTHLVDTFDPDGHTTVYVEIRGIENNDGAVRTLNYVLVENPASVSLIEFTTPWGADDLDGIQVGYPPGLDRIYFVSQTNPIQQLSFNKTTGAFAFGAASITSKPSQWTTNNYPGAIAFFQGRMWVGGTPSQPEMFWGSASGSYLNFTIGSDPADALSFTMANKGAIQWMVGAKNLLIGTEFGEYIATSESGVIMPGDVQVDQQSAYGSARIQPVQIGNRVLYVSPDRRKVRDMGYKWTDDGWISRDITFGSEHITMSNAISQMTFAQNPGNLLFCVTQPKAMIGGTYERGNDIVGWFRSNTDGRTISLASVDLAGTSTVAALFDRDIEDDPTLYYEVCYPAPTGGACVLDCGAILGGDSSVPISSVSVPHLKNKTVRVIVDGALHPDILLDDNGEGDLQWEGYTVGVGLPFSAYMKTLPLASVLQVGQSTLPMMKRFNKIYVRLFDSATPKINGTRPPTRYPSTPMDTPEELVTRDIQVVNLGWDSEAAIVIEQDLPLFTQIAGIFGEAAQEMLG